MIDLLGEFVKRTPYFKGKWRIQDFWMKRRKAGDRDYPSERCMGAKSDGGDGLDDREPRACERHLATGLGIQPISPGVLKVQSRTGCLDHGL